jgi:nucleotidyltransferase/DNA polymerase involved in DNA repair
VEKASYDDFYLCLDPGAKEVEQRTCSLPDANPEGSPSMSNVHLVGCPSVWALPRDLALGCTAALEIQAAIRELGLSASVGVSRSKLLSRLASPLNKPSAVTAVADAGAVQFLHSCSLRKVPGLKGKLGKEVAEALGIETVGELCRSRKPDLVERFGRKVGTMLAELAAGKCSGEVRERGLPKTIICERCETSRPADFEESLPCPY